MQDFENVQFSQQLTTNKAMTPNDFYRLNRFNRPFYKHLQPYGAIPENISEITSEMIQQIITRNQAIAWKIQEEITRKTTPQEGDKIKVDNKLFTIHVRPYEIEGGFALQAGLGDYHHRSNGGGGSYSGTCGEVFKCKSFKDTEIFTEALAWFWANNQSEAENALHYKFNVKIWELIK